MINSAAVKEAIDLREYIQSVGDVEHVVNYSGGEIRLPCPLCGQGAGKRSDFAFKCSSDRFFCHKCRKSGDVLEFIQIAEGCKFVDALKRAAAFAGMDDDGTPWQPKPRIQKQVDPWDKLAPLRLPSMEWLGRSRLFSERTQQYLLSDVGQAAREYLHMRGISVETAKALGVGFNPQFVLDHRHAWGLPAEYYPEDHPTRSGQPKRLWLPRGIVFPYTLPNTGDVWRLKIRLLPHDLQESAMKGYSYPKTYNVKGSAPALFGAQSLAGKRDAVLCEGEFDVLAAYEATAGAVGVLTAGGINDGLHNLSLQHWSVFHHLRRLLVIFDSDGKQATINGAKRWCENLAIARRLQLPVLHPTHTDINDFVLAGGDFSDLVRSAFDELWRY